MAGGGVSAWVYVLRCRDGSLYTGWTNRLEMRLRAHQAGKGGKYTRSRLPVYLVAAWRKRSEKDARRCEVLFKQLTRPAKLVKLKRWGETKSAARVWSRAALCFG